MNNALRIILIFASGLSLFKMGSYLWELELSMIMEGFVAQYDKLLKPVRLVLEPMLLKIFAWFDMGLPEWWVHVFVIWIFTGGIAVRTLDEVDRQKGESPQGNIFERTIASVIMTLMGVFMLILAVLGWQIFYVIAKQQDGVDLRESQGFSPYWLLARETLFAISVAALYFSVNAFAPT